MRYQQQEKGLFTFYKEQEQFQIQIERLKKQRKMEETAKEAEFNRKSLSLNQSYANKKNQPGKYKITSQPAFNNDNAEQITSRNSKVQQIGNSVIIINRKSTEGKEPVKSMRERSYQQKSKQTGYFIEKKNVQFEQLQKYKISSSLFAKKKKKSYLRRRQETRYEASQRLSTKLPTLIKVEQNDIEQELNQHSQRPKPVGSSLKYHGGELIKFIRTSIHSENQIQTDLIKKSVSYIQYNKGYQNETSPRRLDTLNDQQKRLLEVLYKFRKTDN